MNKKNTPPKALFIGHFVTDVNIKLDRLPHPDEKIEMQARKSSFGGNAVTAAFAYAHLGNNAELVTQVGLDSKAAFEMRVAEKFGLKIHPREAKRSSENIVLIVGATRSILKAPNTEDFYAYSAIPELDIKDYNLLHVDCTMEDAALAYAKKARAAGVATSLDGSRFNDHVDELLNFIDIAVVSKEFMEHFGTLDATFDYLKKKGVKVAAVTQGAKGTHYVDFEHNIAEHIPAYDIEPAKIKSTNGAGDIFHGAYAASFTNAPEKPWHEHFTFATAASAHSIQHLTNMESCPTRDDIENIRQHSKIKAISDSEKTVFMP